MRPEQATRPLFKEGCSHVLVPPELKRDCGHCHGLCCVLLYCSKSEGFPQDKPPGTPCIFLAADYRCSVHERLAEKGLSGCMAFDCLGAGQRLTRLLEEHGGEKFSGIANRLPHMMERHWLWWCLWQGWWIRPCAVLKDEAQALVKQFQAADDEEEEAAAPMEAALNEAARSLLARAAEMVCAAVGGRLGQPGRDYAGRDLRGADLTGRDFRGAWLMGADLRGAGAYGANFMGADLRDTRLEDADLGSSLFLTPAQLQAARGNTATKLPPFLEPPDHWR